MKRHLNTLFVTTQNTWLSKDGECVSLRAEGRELGKVPIHTIGSLVCFGQVSCSSFLLGHCARNGVTVSWLTENGRFMAAMHGPTTGNVLLRREQYRRTDSAEGALPLARAFITGKIVNCRTVLRRTAREHPEEHADGGLARACESLTSCLQRLPRARSLDALRGLEGEAAGTYFSVFDRLISARAKGIRFTGRSRRPPLDEINCLLSFLYTLLAADLRGAIESVGLDPAVGFLHRDRPGRPSLALDMMEEFRPVLADRLALTLVNRGQIGAKDFEQTASGAVLLKEKARKEVLVAYQERKREEMLHPFLNERMTTGLLWHMQARLLARHIRGEMDAYPPFVIR
ncbi:type I-C CRISPR-associated endonuclease Cas1c [Desulfovibrio sp. SGI.169]|uniref:type I-C CRISPR-associated endonuclease Cas1c n=1 Tax=Desulfovibrio sp. SGI.169 TaxID=3420561 RepID=UPI003D02684A